MFARQWLCFGFTVTLTVLPCVHTAACADAPYAQVKRAAEGVSADCQPLGGSRTATVEECRRATCAAGGNTFNIREHPSNDNCYMKGCTGGTMPWTTRYGGYDAYTTLPCFNANGGCDHLCHDNGIVTSCSCRPGFTMQSDLNTCQDDNECDRKPCHQNCTNTPGSYTCSCHPGYEVDVNPQHCRDIDECSRDPVPCSHTCENTQGSYICKCPSGYRLDGDIQCVDVNECDEGVHNCNQTCTNTPGGYTCSCTHGFTSSDSGTQCHDIDECASGPCSQSCRNTPGGYNCSCRAEYDLAADGHQCEDQCTGGFRLSVSRSAGVSSGRPTLKILQNVTLDQSMHVACNISSNVINVLDNVHVLKQCRNEEVGLIGEHGGWDVYNRFSQTIATSDPGPKPTLPTWAIGTIVAVVVVVVIAVIVVAVLLRRRSSRTTEKPVQAVEDRAIHAPATASGTRIPLPDTSEPDQTQVGRNPSEGVYEDIEGLPSVTDTPDQTYYNVQPHKAVDNYDSLNKDEINVPVANEYDSMTMS